MRLSDYVSFSVYMKIFLKLTFFATCPEVWIIFVRTIVFAICIILGVLNGPSPTPTPIPGVNVKVPSRGGNVETNSFWCFFYDFYEKLKNNEQLY